MGSVAVRGKQDGARSTRRSERCVTTSPMGDRAGMKSSAAIYLVKRLTLFCLSRRVVMRYVDVFNSGPQRVSQMITVRLRVGSK